jgi:hypothetical protein
MTCLSLGCGEPCPRGLSFSRARCALRGRLLGEAEPVGAEDGTGPMQASSLCTRELGFFGSHVEVHTGGGRSNERSVAGTHLPGAWEVVVEAGCYRIRDDANPRGYCAGGSGAWMVLRMLFSTQSGVEDVLDDMSVSWS